MTVIVPFLYKWASIIHGMESDGHGKGRMVGLLGDCNGRAFCSDFTASSRTHSTLVPGNMHDEREESDLDTLWQIKGTDTAYWFFIIFSWPRSLKLSVT